MTTYKLLLQKTDNDGPLVVEYNHMTIKVFEEANFSHKLATRHNQPKIFLQMPMNAYACIGTCPKCQHNWFHIHKKNVIHKQDRLSCHCKHISTDSVFDIHMCQICQYLSHVIIKVNHITIAESLHLCKCMYYPKHDQSSSLREDAYRFLTCIRLS